jgi:hypothetical protein|tara:strand:- start:2150 stop:3382 length:1233 start_codon:yes stop_codon:yes gene_type:complete
MKSFLGFFLEARTSRISDQAIRLGLTGDGHGNWFDKEGKMVAKTEKGKLVKLTGREASAQEEQPAQQKQQTQEPNQESQFGTFADGTPRRMSPPTRADGSPKEDLGPLTVTFGRFNPPTIGHQKLLDAARKSAGKGDLKIYPSRSQDPKKNPYDPDEKSEVMRAMFPDHAGSIVNDPNARTIFDVLKQAHQDGYSSVKIVVGGDRVKEFEKLSGDYNGKLYDFSGVETVSAGDRDPDSEGVEGMSASKMRKAAAENDFETYRSGIPDIIDDKTAKLMMKTMRQRMKVSEGYNLWEIAPKFDWKNLRENFVNGNIFKVDQLVENLNTGMIGKIVRRGTNYLICVTEDNIMFKSWIRDLKEKKINYPGPSGVPATQRGIGTDSLRDYTFRMTGVKNAHNFINKYKKKKKLAS